MTSQTKPISRRCRNYVRISVRGLIVLVLLIGAGLGWMVRCAQIQRDAVAAINNAGSNVLYDWDWSTGNGIGREKPWAARWLVDLIGVDHFGHVTGVWLMGTTNDAAIVAVGRLTRVQSLTLNSSSINDAGLAHLNGLTSLVELDLRYNQVSDAGLAHLMRLSNLTVLWLDGTQVTDAGVQELQKALPNARIYR